MQKKYTIYTKFSVVIEKQVDTITADSESDALDKAFENEESIMDNLRKEYGESVEFEEFIIVEQEE